MFPYLYTFAYRQICNLFCSYIKDLLPKYFTIFIRHEKKPATHCQLLVCLQYLLLTCQCTPICVQGFSENKKKMKSLENTAVLWRNAN